MTKPSAMVAAGILGALTLALAPAAAQAAPASPAASAAAPKALRPAGITEERCYYLAPSSNSNRLCVQIVTDALGKWTGVRTTYHKATSGPVTIQLGWAHTDGSPGNATGYYTINGPTSSSYEWDGVNPRGCVVGTMNVSGQGHYDTYGGSPGNGVFCS